MKTLLLMRHGKSDWSGGTSDKLRPINGRGQLAATLMAAWMQREGLLPEHMLVSSATRTCETADWMGMSWQNAPSISFQDRLYLAESDMILRVIREEAQGDCVLVLGHNPGMVEAVMRLPSRIQDLDMPTCAVVALTFDVESWHEIRFGMGTLIHAVTPKSLV